VIFWGVVLIVLSVLTNNSKYQPILLSGFAQQAKVARVYYFIIGLELIMSGVLHNGYVSEIILPAAVLVTSLLAILVIVRNKPLNTH
jgi:hypothetical protein